MIVSVSINEKQALFYVEITAAFLALTKNFEIGIPQKN